MDEVDPTAPVSFGPGAGGRMLYSLLVVLLFVRTSPTLAETVLEGVGGACGNTVDCGFGLICEDRVCRRADSLGQACKKNRDCRSPNFVCILGSCAPMARSGEQCDDAYDCREGGPCVDHICVEYATLGESCTSKDDCQGVLCNSTCVQLKQIGGKCESPSDCVGVATCTQGVCTFRGGIGAECAETADCATHLVCDDGTCCDTEGQCSPSGTIGQSCVSAVSDCRNSSELLSCVDDKCAPLSPVGGPCGSPRDCWDGNPCENGKCVYYESFGNPCSSPTDCQNVACVSGTCLAPAAFDAKCFGETPGCLGSLVCANGVCGPAQVEGESCGTSGACLPGLSCEDGTCTDDSTTKTNTGATSSDGPAATPSTTASASPVPETGEERPTATPSTTARTSPVPETDEERPTATETVSPTATPKTRPVPDVDDGVNVKPIVLGIFGGIVALVCVGLCVTRVTRRNADMQNSNRAGKSGIVSDSTASDSGSSPEEQLREVTVESFPTVDQAEALDSSQVLEFLNSASTVPWLRSSSASLRGPQPLEGLDVPRASAAD